jgi:dolichol-phosphate mannosyltransferase
VIPAWNERPNIEVLVPQLQDVLRTIGVASEIVIVDANSPDGTAAAAERLGARVVQQVERGYGGALLAGFAATTAARIVTMDADLSHPQSFIESLWNSRGAADVLIASRYVAGGSAEMPRYRYVLSRILNITFAVLLRMAHPGPLERVPHVPERSSHGPEPRGARFRHTRGARY